MLLIFISSLQVKSASELRHITTLYIRLLYLYTFSVNIVSHSKDMSSKSGTPGHKRSRSSLAWQVEQSYSLAVQVIESPNTQAEPDAEVEAKVIVRAETKATLKVKDTWLLNIVVLSSFTL